MIVTSSSFLRTFSKYLAQSWEHVLNIASISNVLQIPLFAPRLLSVITAGMFLYSFSRDIQTAFPFPYLISDLAITRKGFSFSCILF